MPNEGKGKISAGASIAKRSGAPAITFALERHHHLIPREQVFAGANPIEYGANLFLSAIKNYGICVVDFYRQWGAIASSLAGALGISRTAAAALLALMSPQTHAAQNLVGSVLYGIQRAVKRGKQVKPPAPNLEDTVAEIQRLVQVYGNQSLSQTVAKIKQSEEDVVDQLMTLIEELDQILPQLQQRFDPNQPIDISQFVEELYKEIQEIASKAPRSVWGEPKANKTILPFETRIKTIKEPQTGKHVKQKERVLKLQPHHIQQAIAGIAAIKGVGLDDVDDQIKVVQQLLLNDPEVRDFFAVALLKGEEIFAETKNRKVSNFLRNILSFGEDPLPTMDTRMMEAFGAFVGLNAAEREAIQEALFNDPELYMIWSQEAGEYFSEIAKFIEAHTGQRFTVAEIQAGIWQTIRGYKDLGLVSTKEGEGRFVIPAIFPHLFPKTLAHLINQVRKLKNFPITPQELEQQGALASTFRVFKKLVEDTVEERNYRDAQQRKMFAQAVKDALIEAIDAQLETIKDIKALLETRFKPLKEQDATLEGIFSDERLYTMANTLFKYQNELKVLRQGGYLRLSTEPVRAKKMYGQAQLIALRSFLKQRFGDSWLNLDTLEAYIKSQYNKAVKPSEPTSIPTPTETNPFTSLQPAPLFDQLPEEPPYITEEGLRLIAEEERSFVQDVQSRLTSPEEDVRKAAEVAKNINPFIKALIPPFGKRPRQSDIHQQGGTEKIRHKKRS